MFQWLRSLVGGSRPDVDFSVIGVDMHSHLIPGIDDGSQCLEESVALIEQLQGFGYRKVITTPHIMYPGFENGPDTILPGLEQLRAELKAKNIAVEVDAAAEYYYNEHFWDLIEKKELMTFSGNKVLFELPTMNAPVDLREKVFAMTSNGYVPVLAHVERYPYLYENGLDEFDYLRNMGVLLQVNIGTFAGVYKDQLKFIAYKLAEKEMVDLIGTDLHSERHLSYLEMALKDRKFLRLLDNYRFMNSDL